jgi:hypothetical protein
MSHPFLELNIPRSHQGACELYSRFPEAVEASYGLVFSDPIDFDRRTFHFLYQKYGRFLGEVLHRLRHNDVFNSQSLNTTFRKYLDAQLVCKQLMPLFATADAHGLLKESEEDLIQFGLGYVITKTTALNALDTHVDLSISYNTEKDVAQERDSRATTLLCISSIFRGFNLLNSGCAAGRSVDIVSSVFAEVMEIMFEDYRSRFNIHDLTVPDKRLDLYKNGKLSPLKGSGFYEATIRSGLAIIGVEEQPGMDVFLTNFRKLRQIVDEIADVPEDIRVGRLTFPVLIGLTNDKFSHAIISTVRRIWEISGEIVCLSSRNDMSTIATLKEDTRLKSLVSDLGLLLEQSNAWEEAYVFADNLFLEVVESMEKLFPPDNLGSLLEIALLKRAFLERLRKQSWQDIPLEPLSAPVFIKNRPNDFDR